MDDLTREFIAESREGLDRMERCLTELESKPGDRELVAEIFRAVHTIKGATGFLGFGRLETLTHVGENLLGSLRAGKVAVTAELVGGLLALLDRLRAILVLIETTGTEGERATDDDAELIAQIVALNLGTSMATQTVVAEPVHSVDPAERRAVQGTDRTLRIDVEVLNRLMNLVGELVLTRNQILQSGPAGESFGELARRLDTVTSALRESVMRARMQPVGHLFGKFPRLVRDLAKLCGRRVRIEFEGQETGLDKSLLEAVRDPLTHAMRNAVDHGIESPEVRVAAGKNAEGVVRLRAFHENGSVVIEVSDDGAGVAVDRILAKAVERGLVRAEQAAQMPEREAMQLIFAPGLSTTEQVTNVSGRGVGMDVVRENVEAVGGSVEVESRAGVGTKVRLRLPLTLAIVPALLVRSGGQSFALPQRSVLELMFVPCDEVGSTIERMGSAELYRLRERLIPLVRLDRLLALTGEPAAEARGMYIVVMELEGGRYGLAVEALLAPEEIVVKPLSPVLRRSGVFSGATVRGNGEMAMILDVAGIAARAGVKISRVVRAAKPAEAREETARDERAMVVYEVRRREGGVERRAVPLQMVDGIEMVAREEIEFAAGRPVLLSRGELVAVEDEGRMLHEAAAGALTILYLRPETVGGKKVGVIVERVVEVAPQATVCAGGDDGLAVVDGRVTVVRDGLTGRGPNIVLGEVA